MASSTHQSFWPFLALLMSLHIGKADAWWPRQSSGYPSFKSAPIGLNCGPSDWSAWSECTPFCGYNPVRTKTRVIKKNNKCVKETSEQKGVCPARGGCDFCDEVKKCFCYPGQTLRGKKCVDIDECQSNGGRGPCSHSCENTFGTYTCNCNKGYRLVGKTKCALLDCKMPVFSKCPQAPSTTKAEANLPLCANITSSCRNGTTYNSRCTLSCPKYYKLALKKSTIIWRDFSGFEFRGASSSIICHETAYGDPIWDSQLTQYYCRRSNDPPLVIQLDGTLIQEGLPPGSTVGRLSTRDTQNDQRMVYSVQSYQGKSSFRCNGSVLESSLVFKWHPHGMNSYPVRIRAQDNGSPPMWAERVFNISVENVNDPPKSIEISKNWVYENASVGKVVGELSAIDEDIGNQRSSNFSWKLLEDTSGNFKITGYKVVVNRALNYDTIKLCYIKVACSDFLSTTDKEIPIYVRNLIDPPTLSLTGNKIAENSKPGTVITQITSKSESSDNLKFMISETNPNATFKFKLSPHTVCEHHKNATKFNTTCYVNITVSGQLDYEATREYTLQVYVRNDVSSNFKKWNVSVENVNEKPDKLEMNGMSEIPEDMKSGVDICFFMVSDPDNRNEMTQNHSCHIVNSEEDGQYFQVNDARNSLQVEKNKSLNYEIQQSYLVIIQCVDSGVPPLSITRNFIINVTDTDEPIQHLTLSNNQVKENAELGAQVGILDAYDPDIHRPKTMKFSLIGPKDPPFTLQGSDNEILVVNGSINFEENPDYILTIRVTDTEGRYLEMRFVIKVIDVNEAPTDIKLSTQYMNENLAPGSLISNITMIDEDENTMTICTLLEDGEERIALNETTLVAGEKSTDYEKEFSHVVKILLKCCDQYGGCVVKRFNITVKDVNDPPTDILIDNLEARENEKDIKIGKIIILDPDTSSDYHCTLTRNNHTQNSYFKIINSNKTLRLMKELNFEKQQVITFEIICRDKNNGNTSMYFIKQFDLTIVDVNESPSTGCENPLHVSHTQSIGTVIGNLNVTDPDNVESRDTCQLKQKLTYTIISDENLPFEVQDGYLVKSGEVKTNFTYVIGISVQDDGIILARNFTRIQVKRKATFFNCTVSSFPLYQPQIILSTNQIKVGSTNGSVIGYLSMANHKKYNKTYQLMKDRCTSDPFIIQGNKLMLQLTAYPGPRLDEGYTIPHYAMINVKASDTSTGDSTYARFAIFIKDDIKTRSYLCFTNDPVRLSQIAKTPLGPIIIYQSHENNTDLTCPPENNATHQLHYSCNVKPNMKESSKGFAAVNFTNALSVDSNMYLRIKISINVDIPHLEKLVLNLVCWEPHRLFSHVKGKIVIPIAYEGVCEKDRQPRNSSLCRNAKSCPKNSLCSKLVNIEERCVPTADQLFVILPAIKEGNSLCKFEDCLQEMLRDQESGCLSTWNEEGRTKRGVENSLYIDTLNITFLRKQNKLLLRVAVWEVQDGKLTLLLKQDLPELRDNNGVIFITTKEECGWLIDENIKCPINDSGSTTGKSSSTPLKSAKIKAGVGAGAVVFLVVIIILAWNCLKKRRQRNRERQVKHKAQACEFSNMAFDDKELKELPPIPEQEKQLQDDSLHKTKKKTEKLKYNFKNPVYEDPSDMQAVEDSLNHIYNDAIPQNATYAQPEEIQEKSNGKAKGTKAISNPFYEAADVIAVVKPRDISNGINFNNVTILAQASTATKEPEYETLPELKEKDRDNNLQTPPVYACMNKSKQVETELVNPVKMKQHESAASTKEPHYEELPLPDVSEINTRTLLRQSDDQLINTTCQYQAPNKDNANGSFNQALNEDTKISDQKENKYQAGKEPECKELPPLKDVKKLKGFFRLSKAFKDFMDSKQEVKTDLKNSSNSESKRLSIPSEMPGQSMLNPRDKAKKDNPAYKYPFYEELPPVNSRRTKSVFEETACRSDQQNAGDRRSSPYYHVLEGNIDAGHGNQVDIENSENDEKSHRHRYFVLEKCSSTGEDNNQYQSLHRELDPPSPAYESYRLPQKSGSQSGSKACEALSAEGIDTQ